jgi:hypothetical protein
MKPAIKIVLTLGILCFCYSGSLKAQVVENNSSAPLNFTVVIGCADGACATTYEFTLPPHSSRSWREGMILRSTVSDGAGGYTVTPGEDIIVPLSGTLKDVDCTSYKKVIWDHEQL